MLSWLNELVLTGLITQREYHRLKTPKSITSSEVLEVLPLDFQQHSHELEAWSVLYHRFVRVDLDLSWQHLAQLTASTERTLRRRQERGLRRLLSEILALERYLQKYSIQPVANTGVISTD